MKLIEILALVIPPFAAGMYFCDLLTDFHKGNTLNKSDIMWFLLNTVFVIINSILLCGHF